MDQLQQRQVIPVGSVIPLWMTDPLNDPSLLNIKTHVSSTHHDQDTHDGDEGLSVGGGVMLPQDGDVQGGAAGDAVSSCHNVVLI